MAKIYLELNLFRKLKLFAFSYWLDSGASRMIELNCLFVSSIVVLRERVLNGPASKRRVFFVCFVLVGMIRWKEERGYC